jgi:heat-inducible transcriptional repressor
MGGTDFEQRRNKILGLIIEGYLTTAEPVGSASLARKLRSGLSPATIRNIMAELEEAGLVEQPHTSAGRVPTERGYRFYVDSVMDLRAMPPEELRQLEALIQPTEPDLSQLLERASAALAELTRQAAFAVSPTVKRSRIRQIELVPLSVRKILCVLVANEEMIASHVVEVVEPISREEAVALARFINTELVGLSVSDLLESLERRMLAENDSFYHFVKRSLGILQHALSHEPTERLYVEGASYVIAQPEFSRDPRRAHELLRGLDDEEPLLARLRQDLASSGGVRVRIGREVQVPGLEECSYLAAPVAMAEGVVGGIGVLGPKRMDYPRLRGLVEGMSRCLTGLLNRWETGG